MANSKYEIKAYYPGVIPGLFHDMIVPLTMFQFSGGETQVSLDTEKLKKRILFPGMVESGYVNFSITAHIRNGDIMPLALIVDALRRTVNVPIQLNLPYLPYARQDRLMNPGESLALKVFCDFINSLNFKSVTIDDCHSDVGVALLNNVVHRKQHTILKEELFNQFDAVVAPDAGAMKKTAEFVKVLNEDKPTDMIRADKVRDVTTGEITGTEVYGDVEGKTLLIVDDICDGGRTFIELAKVLRAKGAKKIVLMVTHGIFSKGKDVLLEHIDEVYAKYDWTQD